MNKYIIVVAVLIFLVVGGFTWYQWSQSQVTDPVSDLSQNSTDLRESGAFISTYIPNGWNVTENELYNMRGESTDFTLEDPVVISDCAGATNSGCAMNASQKVIAKGAYFNISFDPCLSGASVSEFRQRELSNFAYRKVGVGVQNSSDQTPITVADHDATLFHIQGLTNTTYPTMEHSYGFTVIVSPADCQDISFGFVESSTVDYDAEFKKFLGGLKFVPGRGAR